MILKIFYLNINCILTEAGVFLFTVGMRSKCKKKDRRMPYKVIFKIINQINFNLFYNFLSKNLYY